MALRIETQIPPAGQFRGLFLTTGWNDEYHLSMDELDHALRASWSVVAVYDAARLVGFGRVVSDGVLHAMIYEMIVAPEYQRQGIGALILDRLLRRCRRAGIRDIQLFCARGKAPFYEKHGFAPRPADAPGMQFAVQ